MKTMVFDLKVVKLTNSFHSRVRTQGGNINFFSENCKNRGFKTDFAKNRGFQPNERPLTRLEKVTPTFYLILITAQEIQDHGLNNKLSI